MYKVIAHFHDLQDTEKKTKDGPIYHEYNEGDVYPRDGYEPSQERIEELLGNHNNFHSPIIEDDGPSVVDDNNESPTETASPEDEEQGDKKTSK
jgi:hypothetical protein